MVKNVQKISHLIHIFMIDLQVSGRDLCKMTLNLYLLVSSYAFYILNNDFDRLVKQEKLDYLIVIIQ